MTFGQRNKWIVYGWKAATFGVNYNDNEECKWWKEKRSVTIRSLHAGLSMRYTEVQKQGPFHNLKQLINKKGKEIPF